MKACLIFLTSILTIQVYSQNWAAVNPKPQDNFNAIIFFDDNNGIVAGNNGVIYRTTNAGGSWLSINSGTTEKINSFCFLNSSTGFAVGDFGLIMKTTNAGFNWEHKKSGTPVKINSMAKTPSSILLSSCNSGVQLRSTDGGNLWTLQVISGYNLNHTFVLDENNWFVSGDSDIVLKTSNSGNNWSRNRIINSGFNYSFFSMHFFDIDIGLALSSSKVYKTTNGGINWSEVQMFIGGNYKKLIFISGQLGYIMGNSTPLYKTTNGGLNWFYRGPENSYFYNFRDVCVMDSTKLYMCGDGGQVVKSTDSGRWLEHLGGISFNSCNFSFYDVNGGTVFFQNYRMTTSNGGDKWKILANGMNNWFEPTIITNVKIKFSNYNNGVALIHYSGPFSSTDYVQRTSDGGNSFYGGTGGGLFQTFSDVEAVGNTVIAAGRVLTSNSQIYRADGGGNWVTQYSAPSGYYLLTISFPNSSTGIVASNVNNTNQNFVLRTTNSCSSWTESNLPQTNSVIIADMLNDGNGYLLCDSGMILKTTNFGINWFINLGSNSYRFKTINILDESHCYAITGSNKLAFSSNGGTIWSLHDVLPPGKALYSVQFLNSETGYIAGDSVILKTTNGGLTFVNINQSEIPEKFGLSQNYPNPFNPLTNIKFDIPKSGFVEVTIYNVLGREITQLVNRHLQPGSYSVDWDAANYPSGVYFCTLSTNDYFNTKKMVLIK